MRISGLRSAAASAAAGKTVSPAKPSLRELRTLKRFRDVLQSFAPPKFRTRGWQAVDRPEVIAAAVSSGSIDFGAQAPTTLSSTAEVNTAVTSYSNFEPTLIGSYATVPWSGEGSTALASIGGEYDGSNGDGQITFRVTDGGTHGDDTVKLKVFDPENVEIDEITIHGSDPLNEVYDVSNGLQINLGTGTLAVGNEFIVDVSVVSTSCERVSPDWSGSTAHATIGGTYNGMNGTGDFRFEVTRGGVHGTDNLEIDVYEPGGLFLQTLEIASDDPIGQVYNLMGNPLVENGLTVTLGAGALIEGETFVVSVDGSDPDATGPTEPDWVTGTADVIVGGTYDGSQGTSILTIVADSTGTRSSDNLRLKVFDSSGDFLENVDVDKNDPPGTIYTLSNGLELDVSSGTMIQGESFEISLGFETAFSTAPMDVTTTAAIIFDGVYDGSLGTDTLEFRVSEGGLRGTDEITIDVFDSADTFIESISVAASDSIDTVYTLTTGLTLTVGSGTVARHESFTMTLDHLTESAVDPDAAFHEAGNNRPNFDSGFSVSAGSFDVNGVTIAVLEDDTINSVLNRITTLVGDVTAVFDAATDSIVFSRDTEGPSRSIQLSDDTSGFLAATKLTDAVPVTTGGDAKIPIQQVASLSAVSSGGFRVNGITISLDVATDSIEDVVDRIKAAVANVEAAFDSVTNQLSVVARAGTDLTVDSNGTGFFESLLITPGIFRYQSDVDRSSTHNSGATRQNRETIQATIADFAVEFQDIFQNSNGLNDLKADLQQAIADSFDTKGRTFETSFGLNFDFTGKSESPFAFDTSDQRSQQKALRNVNGTRSLRTLLFGRGSNGEGLIDRLLTVVQAKEQSLRMELTSGVYTNPRLPSLG